MNQHNNMDTDYSFSFLRDKDIPVLHRAFLKAFADYVIPIQLNEEQFQIKLKREGIDLRFCAGAYYQDELIGFIATGLGEFMGKPTAYNGGTGVVPAHRGKGITKKLYEFMFPKLRESGLELCLLEVIQDNTPALHVYQSLGFQEVRKVDSYRVLKKGISFDAPAPKEVTIAETRKPDWAGYADFCDGKPTWQNTAACIKNSPDRKVILEARYSDGLLVGHLVLFPRTGAIAQMAVAPGYRDRGIGTALLREATRLAETPALMLINVDVSCKDFLLFLEMRNFKRILGQYEMVREA